jgi:hypothetical protein
MPIEIGAGEPYGWASAYADACTSPAQAGGRRARPRTAISIAAWLADWNRRERAVRLGVCLRRRARFARAGGRPACTPARSDFNRGVACRLKSARVSHTAGRLPTQARALRPRRRATGVHAHTQRFPIAVWLAD